MEEGYWIKKINFRGRPTPILMQSINGPCPLLAIANVLSLNNAIKLHTDYSNVNNETLISLVADHLLEKNPIVNPTQSENDPYYENKKARLEDAINILPKLDIGLDVNVRFRGIKDFEFT